MLPDITLNLNAAKASARTGDYAASVASMGKAISAANRLPRGEYRRDVTSKLFSLRNKLKRNLKGPA